MRQLETETGDLKTRTGKVVPCQLRKRGNKFRSDVLQFWIIPYDLVINQSRSPKLP
jgi:hypothetical protein